VLEVAVPTRGAKVNGAHCWAADCKCYVTGGMVWTATVSKLQLQVHLAARFERIALLHVACRSAQVTLHSRS
jgi:hypothetical protein